MPGWRLLQKYNDAVLSFCQNLNSAFFTISRSLGINAEGPSKKFTLYVQVHTTIYEGYFTPTYFLVFSIII